MWSKLIILGLVGALIGYSTNVIAIKLLFRPLEPTKLFNIQGLIPKRKPEIAVSIGEIVANELIKVEELMDIFIERMDKEKFKYEIGDKISSAIVDKLPPFIPATIVTTYVDQFINEKGDEFINEISERILHEASTNVKVDQIVEDKIMDFDLIKLEEIILKIVHKELRHIELLGGVLGLIIGLVQGVIVLSI
ncbi:MAG: DUF445 family protein [Clostridiales bacterium]|nr:DUF445 family protein [Clostridiales bacterium]